MPLSLDRASSMFPGAEAPLPRPGSLAGVWVAESIRLTEAHTGWLDDEQANRQARAASSAFADRLQARAWFLARRDGLLLALAAWRHGAVLATLALVLLAGASGLGLAWAALGDSGRPAEVWVVNVYRAVGALLGLHALMLVLWLLGWAWALLGGGTAGGASLPGRIWLWICARWSREARGWQLGPALANVLGRARLMPWLLGVASHGFWLLSLGVALAAVLAMLATRRYGFVWESTLLGDGSLVTITRALGWLPSWLGFPALESATIEASGQAALADAAVRQQWALWLVGLVVVYGLIPRLILLLLCAWGWRRTARRLSLDENLPGYGLLRGRLMPAGEAIGVSDPAPAVLDAPRRGTQAVGGQGAVLFAVELGPDLEWPPELPEGVRGDMHDGGRLDSGAQRQRALDWLQRQPALRLLAACDARRSPDRGTLRLLADLAQVSREMRVWLMQPRDTDALRVQDWRDALAEAALAEARDEPLAWLERGDESPGDVPQDTRGTRPPSTPDKEAAR